MATTKAHAYIGVVTNEDGRHVGKCKCGKATAPYVERITAQRNIVEHITTAPKPKLSAERKRTLRKQLVKARAVKARKRKGVLA